jgi:hypothetical protein
MVKPPLNVTHIEGNAITMLNNEGSLHPPYTPNNNIFTMTSTHPSPAAPYCLSPRLCPSHT